MKFEDAKIGKQVALCSGLCARAGWSKYQVDYYVKKYSFGRISYIDDHSRMIMVSSVDSSTYPDGTNCYFLPGVLVD